MQDLVNIGLGSGLVSKGNQAITWTDVNVSFKYVLIYSKCSRYVSVTNKYMLWNYTHISHMWTRFKSRGKYPYIQQKENVSWMNH